MESSVIQRIKLFIEYKQLNVSQFASEIGMPQPTVNNYVLANRKVSFELIEKMVRTFPDLSLKWIVLGEGDMLECGQSKTCTNINEDNEILNSSHQSYSHNNQCTITNKANNDLAVEILREQIKEKDEQIKALLFVLKSKE